MLKRLSATGIEYIDSIRMLPDEKVGEKMFGVVNLSVANIRSLPKHSSELSTQAILGTPLKIYDQEDNWYRVQTPDGYLGWLDEGGLALMEKGRYNIWKEKEKIIYARDFGFAYAVDSTSSAIVSDLVAGSILAVQKRRMDSLEVVFPDGRTGLIAASEAQNYNDWMDQQPNEDKVLAVAYRHLGRPYLWGGTSGKAMDCSGFTKTVFFEHGLLLPRCVATTSCRKQLRYDTTWQNLLPGDLLFFGRKATPEQKEKITHVNTLAMEKLSMLRVV